MENVFQNTFCGRLRYLYDSMEINADPNERGWSSKVSRQFFDRKIIEYTNPDNDEEQRKQRSSVAHMLRQHMTVTDVSVISGLWLSRYCRFFKCSAAYLFGEISLPTIEQTDVCKATGLSPVAVKEMIDIHGWDSWAVSVAYDERHKPIDCINMIFESGHEDLLYSIYEYVNSGRIVIPDTVSVWDDTGTGHKLPAASLYRAAKLNDVNRHLNEMTP